MVQRHYSSRRPGEARRAGRLLRPARLDDHPPLGPAGGRRTGRSAPARPHHLRQHGPHPQRREVARARRRRTRRPPPRAGRRRAGEGAAARAHRGPVRDPLGALEGNRRVGGRRHPPGAADRVLPPAPADRRRGHRGHDRPRAEARRAAARRAQERPGRQRARRLAAAGPPGPGRRPPARRHRDGPRGHARLERPRRRAVRPGRTGRPPAALTRADRRVDLARGRRPGRLRQGRHPRRRPRGGHRRLPARPGERRTGRAPHRPGPRGRGPRRAPAGPGRRPLLELGEVHPHLDPGGRAGHHRDRRRPARRGRRPHHGGRRRTRAVHRRGEPRIQAQRPAARSSSGC